MENKKKCLLVIDSNSLIHRAYHALPPLTTKKGELVNAVYGFLLVFLKAIRDFQPDYIAAAFDFPAPCFRHKKYKEYKAKRPKTPEDLSRQIPKIKEVLKAFNVPIFEKEGFEGDDIIGTISFLSPIETIILSGDLDALQLVDSKTKVYALRKGVKDIILYDENLVKEKFQGLFPEQILDFKALKGDASDNIPGVTGIGEKTAIELLLKFGSLENIYKEVEENRFSSSPFAVARELEENSEKAPKESKHPTGQAKDLKPRLKEILLKYKEQAFLSKMLTVIKRDVAIDFNFKKCQWGEYNKKEVLEIFKKWGFNSLIDRLLKAEQKGEESKLSSSPFTAAREVKEEIKNPRKESVQKNLRLW